MRKGVLLLAGAALLAAGCTRGSTSSNPPIHLNPNMDDQPRYEAQASSDFFADGAAMRTPVEGTVARSALDLSTAIATGTSGGAPLDRSPIPVDEVLLERGAERYAIYCGPCHAENGNGQSMLRQKAGVATTDLTQDRLLGASDGYLFDVITNGFGLMPAYAYPIPPRDRWAIVAWVRNLQREAPPSGAVGLEGADMTEPGELETADAGAETEPIEETGETPAEDSEGDSP